MITVDLAAIIGAALNDETVTVFDALDATEHLTDSTAPDELLIALAGADGVDGKSIKIRTFPRPSRRGLHVVTWTQHGAQTSREGYTLDRALRRAVAASGAEVPGPTPKSRTGAHNVVSARSGGDR